MKNIICIYREATTCAKRNNHQKKIKFLREYLEGKISPNKYLGFWNKCREENNFDKVTSVIMYGM